MRGSPDSPKEEEQQAHLALALTEDRNEVQAHQEQVVTPRAVLPEPEGQTQQQSTARNETSGFICAATDSQDRSSVGASRSTNISLLDSGTSGHYLRAESAPLSKSKTVRADPESKVSSADASIKPMQSLGRIDGVAVMDNGERLELTNAMLLGPELQPELLSVGALTTSGYTFIFLGEFCHIIKANKIIKSVRKYPLSLRPTNRETQAENKEEAHSLELLRKLQVELCQNHPTPTSSRTANIQTQNTTKRTCEARFDENLPNQAVGDSFAEFHAGQRSDFAVISSHFTANPPLSESKTPTKVSDVLGKTRLFHQDRTALTMTYAGAEQQMALLLANYAQHQALLTKSFIGTTNLKRLLHLSFAHQSIARGTPLYNAAAKAYGSAFTSQPDVPCHECACTAQSTPPASQATHRSSEERGGWRRSTRRLLRGYLQHAFSW